jgi:hypothetical protein
VPAAPDTAATPVAAEPPADQPGGADAWARPVTTLSVAAVPPGAVNLNVEGRPVVGPLQGFGPLWQKTFRVRLPGVAATPAEVIRLWKEHFPEFLPPTSRFYPSITGVQPGEVVLINAAVSGLPVYTGVLVLYADDESFTLMTAKGLPEAGWNTFSAAVEDGCTVAQIQTMARANDPLYEIGFRLFGSREQDQIWTHMLTALAARYGVSGQVSLYKTCLDPALQWSRVGNVRHNAALRSMVYLAMTPLRAGGAGASRLLRRARPASQ